MSSIHNCELTICLRFSHYRTRSDRDRGIYLGASIQAERKFAGREGASAPSTTMTLNLQRAPRSDPMPLMME